MLGNKEMSVVDVSVYHNLVVVGGHDPVIYFYNYELADLMHVMTLPAEPTALAFVNGFSLLLLTTADYHLHALQFTYTEAVFTIKPIAMLHFK